MNMNNANLDDESRLKSMAVHETTTIDFQGSVIRVLRVFTGWIYMFKDSSKVFVIDNEGQEQVKSSLKRIESKVDLILKQNKK